MSPLHVPAGAAQWDERRNTSRTIPVPPDALEHAYVALEGLRRNHPALVQWLEDGHPTMTDAEHVARFGEAYRRGGR